MYFLYKSNFGLFENDFINLRNVYLLISKWCVKLYDDVFNVFKFVDFVLLDYLCIMCIMSMCDLWWVVGLCMVFKKECYYSS